MTIYLKGGSTVSFDLKDVMLTITDVSFAVIAYCGFLLRKDEKYEEYVLPTCMIERIEL